MRVAAAGSSGLQRFQCKRCCVMLGVFLSHLRLAAKRRAIVHCQHANEPHVTGSNIDLCSVGDGSIRALNGSRDAISYSFDIEFRLRNFPLCTQDLQVQLWCEGCSNNITIKKKIFSDNNNNCRLTLRFDRNVCRVERRNRLRQRRRRRRRRGLRCGDEHARVRQSTLRSGMFGELRFLRQCEPRTSTPLNNVTTPTNPLGHLASAELWRLHVRLSGCFVFREKRIKSKARSCLSVLPYFEAQSDEIRLERSVFGQLRQRRSVVDGKCTGTSALAKPIPTRVGLCAPE